MGRRLCGVVIIAASLAPSLVTLGQVVINEVAWGGSPEGVADEWIELLNPGAEEVLLDGWRLVSSDGSPDVPLAGALPGGGFFLLERDTDEAAPGVPADLLYGGALNDGGEALRLFAPDGTVVDTANEAGGAWPAGSNGRRDAPDASMERIDPLTPDLPANWASSGARASGGSFGSPRAANSALRLPCAGTFEASPHPAHPGETVSFSAPAAAEGCTFLWEFGDGATTEGTKTSHSYPGPGTYLVRLTVTDPSGRTTSAAREVRVIVNDRPVADFSVRSASGNRAFQTLDPILYLDESFDPDGRVVKSRWTFGDGESAAGTSTSHAYSRSGRYEVTLAATDDQGETSVRAEWIEVANRPPVARFLAPPGIPNPGQEVVLDAASSFDQDGGVVSYAWDFDGDGTIDLETGQETASHAFPEGGVHAVALRVSDGEGASSLPVVEEVVVNRAPIVSFQVSAFSPPELAEVTFTDASSDLDGTVVHLAWDFGDGATGEGPSVVHAYAPAGTYTVTLTAIDDRGAEGRAMVTLDVQNLPPAAVLEVDACTATARRETGQEIRFDGSRSSDPSPGGRIVRYEWDLNGNGTFDQSTTVPTFVHRYTQDGTYGVRLRVTDDRGTCALSASLLVEVANRPPLCQRISWSPEAPVDGETVVFSGSTSDPDGKVAAYLWDLGNGEIARGQTASRAFSDGGTYRVSLTVWDDDGASSAPRAIDLSVANAAPIAAFTVLTALPRVGEPVAFADRSADPSAGGTVVYLGWDFGDGGHCPGALPDCGEGLPRAPTHVYAAPGLYTVTLTTIDDEGAVGRASLSIFISD